MRAGGRAPLKQLEVLPRPDVHPLIGRVTRTPPRPLSPLGLSDEPRTSPRSHLRAGPLFDVVLWSYIQRRAVRVHVHLTFSVRSWYNL